MNKIRKIMIFILLFVSIISIANFSQAGVEMKEGTTAYTSVNISESFDICYNLRDGTSTLGNCDLDPHLATSLDWGAVAYLAQSRYGGNSSSISSNTTGNKSGVMNMNTWTQTATLFESRNKNSTNAKQYRFRLEEAIADSNLSKYVDVISNTVDVDTTKGRAMAETINWYGANYNFQNSTNSDVPIIIRDSLFGVYYYGGYTAGQANASLTFRPVIWN